MAVSRPLPVTLAIVSLAFAALPTGPAPAGEPSSDPLGQREYVRYCAACHGESGRGDGPVGPSFEKAVPDLTSLGQRYGTPLPRAELIEIIDGTQLAHAHGTRDMPVWGDQLYGGLGGSEKAGRNRGTILIILDYLQTLQRP